MQVMFNKVGRKTELTAGPSVVEVSVQAIARGGVAVGEGAVGEAPRPVWRSGGGQGEGGKGEEGVSVLGDCTLLGPRRS